jgi:quercetin dioxygenase-like cupin family protein/DNA-binding XRE family transcriptional regulator
MKMTPQDTLGKRVKNCRKQMSLSLRQLASKTSLTASFISQVEHDQTNPSIDSLRRIAEALGVSILYFLTDQREQHTFAHSRMGTLLKHVCAVRSNARPKLFLPVSGLTYELLSPDLARKMETILGRIEPGTGNVARRLREPTEEFIFVLSGVLRVGLDNDEYDLQAGDSIYFEGNQMRKLECASPNQSAEWISVITPPVF